MNDILGLIRFDGSSAERLDLSLMAGTIITESRPLTQFSLGRVVFGVLQREKIREAAKNSSDLPRMLASGVLFLASARIDNRDELLDKLDLATERNAVADHVLIERAYIKWGTDCVERIYGDWSFAVWDPHHKRLFLARDHHGNTSLYYTINDRYAAFASSRKVLLALDDPQVREVDDLYLAQLMLSWPVYHGERTAHKAIKRLPPAHFLVATQTTNQAHRYWYPENKPELQLSSRDEAVEGFVPIWNAAVRSRIRDKEKIATTLSGGLDSGSVTVTAAQLLNRSGRSLLAYTSVPYACHALNNKRRFGDEWEFAALAASGFHNIDHRRITSAGLTPLQALQIALETHDEPQHAVGNAFWIIDLFRIAAADGCDVVLTGQGGNASISWAGAKSDTLHRQRMTPAAAVKRLLENAFPHHWNTSLRVRVMKWREPWLKSLAIHRDLIARTDVLSRSIHDPCHPIHVEHADSRTRRLALIKFGRSIVGNLHAENGAAYGVDIRDPTLDTRVLEYCLAVPDSLLRDEATGLDRMLIRAAMKGLLPDPVRLNRKRGLQAADLPARLRADRAAMEACLDELQQGVSAQYVNMKRLRQSWKIVQERDDTIAYREAGVVLLRAIMVGMFVNQTARLNALSVAA